MDNSIIDKFHALTRGLLTRDRSLLDVITRLQESNAKLNRSIAKSVTKCGCISLEAKKQHFPENSDLSSLPIYADDHILGHLCLSCRKNVELLLGDNLFYLACLCNALDMNLGDIMEQELDRCNMLGKFNLK